MMPLLRKNITIWTLIILSLVACSYSNQCLNHDGENVDWWVKLVIPSSVPGGYAYFDSTFSAPSFVVYQDQADALNTPLFRTLNQINNEQLNTIAWNDQKPNGTTSSAKAHAKGVLSYNENTNKGFIIIHSLPQYPAFVGKMVNITISDSQRIYGQHMFCLSAVSETYYDLITKIVPIRPFLYLENFVNNGTINKLIETGIIAQPDYFNIFTTRNYAMNNHNFLFLFKNGGVNASIFQDGLNNILQSPLIAQTWGRPLLAPWCGSDNFVGNINNIKISQTIFWSQTKDHSKWAYTTTKDYSCFGDMNRMASQWKRGGAFYCVNSALLKQALVSITANYAGC